MLKRTPLEVGTTYPGRLGASLKILELPKSRYGGRLEGKIAVERTFPPGGGRSPEHWHGDFSEIYEIVSGIADAWVRGEKRRLKGGDTLRIGPHVYHVNPHNSDSARLTLRHTIEPATEPALAYIATLAHTLLDGRDRKGELPRVAALAVFDELDGRTWVRRVPVWSQRHVLLPIGGRIARHRGYTVRPARHD